MRPGVKQARDGIKRSVDMNRTTLEITRGGTTDNGFGGTMPDPSASTTETIRARISHKAKGPSQASGSPAGYTSDLDRIIIVEHTVQLYKGDRFSYLGKDFEILDVDPLRFYDEIIGYQADLKEAV